MSRTSWLGLLTAAFVSPPSFAEARSGDRIATTAGYTSGVNVVAGTATLNSARLEVWLHGDHATLRGRYDATGAASFGVIGGESTPTPGVPGGLVAGAFPSFLNGAGMPRRGLAPYPLPKLPLQFDSAPRAWMHVVTEPWADVVWTVPYAGDTYGTAGPLDCSCGDPWNFTINNAWLMIDAAPKGYLNAEPAARVELVLHNDSGVPVTVFRSLGSEPQMLLPNATATVHYGGAPALGPLLVSFLRGWRPGLAAFTGTEQTGRIQWPTRLGWSCTYDTKADHDAPWQPPPSTPEWRFRCNDEHVELPAFVRDHMAPTNAYSSDPLATWVAAGLFRERLNGRGPQRFEDWPFKAAGRVSPERYTVTASSTLGAESVLHLSDGKPDTAWCEGAEGFGVGSELRIDFKEPTPVTAIGLLPGFVSADYLYEANAVPTSAALRPDDRDWLHDGWSGTLLASADLYKEGHHVEVKALQTPKRVKSLTLRFAGVRPGKFTGDMCVSELLVLGRE